MRGLPCPQPRAGLGLGFGHQSAVEAMPVTLGLSQKPCGSQLFAGSLLGHPPLGPEGKNSSCFCWAALPTAAVWVFHTKPVPVLAENQQGSYRLAQLSHCPEGAQTSQVNNSIPIDHLLPFQRPASSPRLSPVLLTNWLSIGGSHNPLLGLDNLL